MTFPITVVMTALIALTMGVYIGRSTRQLPLIPASPSPIAQTPDTTPAATNDESVVAQPGAAFLTGQISSLQNINGQITANVQLVETFNGQDSMEQAALIDGACTLDQIESGACLNSPFYSRSTKKNLTLTIDPDAMITVYAREPRGGMLINADGTTYTANITGKAFADMYTQQAKAGDAFSKTLYSIHINGNGITQIKEKLTP